MTQRKTPPWLDELLGYLLPSLLVSVILIDWAFPLRPAVRYLENHDPGNLRVCVSIVSNDSEKTRTYFLFPQFFDEQTLIEVSVRADGDHRIKATRRSPLWPTVVYIVFFGNLVRVVAKRISDNKLEKLIASTRGDGGG